MFISILRHTCDNSKIARLQNNFFNKLQNQNKTTMDVKIISLILDFLASILPSRLATFSVSNFKQAEMSVMTFTRFRKLAEDA